MKNIAAPVRWELARNDLDAVDKACREELDAAKASEKGFS
jgi:hypothetical protein